MRIVACCDASEEALARFQRELELSDSQCFMRYEEFLAAGPEIVFLGTPSRFIPTRRWRRWTRAATC